jgi:hypothetical protein
MKTFLSCKGWFLVERAIGTTYTGVSHREQTEDLHEGNKLNNKGKKKKLNNLNYRAMPNEGKQSFVWKELFPLKILRIET